MISCLLIFWNLYRGQPNMPYHFSFVHLMMVGLVLPGLAFGALRWLLNRGQRVEVKSGDDADDEWNDSKAAG